MFSVVEQQHLLLKAPRAGFPAVAPKKLRIELFVKLAAQTWPPL